MLHVPQESAFLGPLKYIDVVQRTKTTLDTWQEHQFDEYWNVVGDRKLAVRATGRFHTVHDAE